MDGCGLFDARGRPGSHEKHYGNFNEERGAVLHCVYHVSGFGLQPHVRRRKSLIGSGFLLSGIAVKIYSFMMGDDGPTHAIHADFFFQVVFVATAMSVVSGAVAERMKLELRLAVVFTVRHLSHSGPLVLAVAA